MTAEKDRDLTKYRLTVLPSLTNNNRAAEVLICILRVMTAR